MMLSRRLSSSVVVCNTPRTAAHICNVTHQGAARDGGPVVLRNVGQYLFKYKRNLSYIYFYLYLYGIMLYSK